VLGTLPVTLNVKKQYIEGLASLCEEGLNEWQHRLSFDYGKVKIICSRNTSNECRQASYKGTMYIQIRVLYHKVSNINWRIPYHYCKGEKCICQIAFNTRKSYFCTSKISWLSWCKCSKIMREILLCGLLSQFLRQLKVNSQRALQSDNEATFFE